MTSTEVSMYLLQFVLKAYLLASLKPVLGPVHDIISKFIGVDFVSLKNLKVTLCMPVGICNVKHLKLNE